MNEKKTQVNFVFILMFCLTAIQVEHKNESDYKNQTFIFYAGNGDQLILQPGFHFDDVENGENNQTRLSFVSYQTLQSLLHGDTLA